MKGLVFCIVAIFGLVGCGGGSSGNLLPEGTMSSSDLNLTKDIHEGKIADYDKTDPIEDQYLAIINYFRSLEIKCNDAKAITGPSGKDMNWNLLLANAAKEHSEDMNLSAWYGHNGSGTINDITGQTLTPVRASIFSERIENNGYNGSLTAENIAMIRAKPIVPSADSWIKVMEGWMKSTDGHCSNIMNPKLTEFGMYESRADVNASGWYNVYWTQDFGSQ